jgi:hypothetical protein
MASVAHARAIAAELPRSYETVVRDRLKFRVGRIVYASFSRDEAILGFAYPKDERGALVVAEPGLFLAPERADERYNWVQGYLAAIDERRLREVLTEAWLMVVPKRVGAAYLAGRADPG